MGTVIPSGGCIRLYSTGAEWHIDPEHYTGGLFNTTVQPYVDAAGYLIVELVDSAGIPNENPVMFIDAEEDETLTARDIRVGPSNGGHIIKYRFFSGTLGILNLNVPEHWDAVTGIHSNIWVTAQHWNAS